MNTVRNNFFATPWCLAIIALNLTGASFAQSGGAPDAAWRVETLQQNINVEVTVPEGTYRFAAAGSCGIGEQAIDVEGFSDDGMYGITVSRDPYSGLVLFFTNNESEWEVTLGPGEDDSELFGNRFRFSGMAMLNYDDSDLQAIAVELVCPER